MVDLVAYARDAAQRRGLDPAIFERQIRQESGFNPQAYNAQSGASGIAQIVERFHPGVDVWNPTASLDYAAQIMVEYRHRFGTYAKALASFNWGSGNVGGYTKADGTVVSPWNGERATLPAETRRYLDVILGEGWTEPGADPVTVTYNRESPAVLQNDPWSCAPSSTRWGLEAVGRHPSEQWIESTMKAEGVVSEEQGLLDASGAGLADFLNRHYGEFAYRASHEPIATFQALAAESGRYPLMIGGRNWGGPGAGHWAGLRAYDAVRDVLLLANPASGATYGGQEMTRAQMAERGPFSMVRLTHPDLLLVQPSPPPAPTPVPVPPPVDPKDVRIAELEAALAAEQEKVAGFVNALAFLGDDQGDQLQGVVNELRRVRAQFVGERPA